MKILAIVPDYIPSITIGIITPLSYLAGQGHIDFDHCLEQEVHPEQVLNADVIVTGRNTEPLYKPVYELAIAHRIPIIVDLDDNLLEVPDRDQNRIYYRQAKRHEHLEWMLRNASLVRVYSPVLRDIAGAYNAHVVLSRAAIDWSLVPPQLPEISLDPIHIVYATSRIQTDPIFEQLLPDLNELLVSYQDKIQLHFLGYHPRQFRNMRNVDMKPFEPDYKTFFSNFTCFGYAIGLAPMLEGRFYASKTDNKFREYAAAGAVGIYKDAPPYSDTEGIIQNETGILVTGQPGSWSTAVDTLIRNPQLLASIRTKARRYAEETYDLPSVAQTWLEQLQAQPPPQPVDVLPTSQWWFTRDTITESQLTAKLRMFYRTRVPVQWRLRLRQIILLARWIAFKLRKTDNTPSHQ